MPVPQTDQRRQEKGDILNSLFVSVVLTQFYLCRTPRSHNNMPQCQEEPQGRSKRTRVQSAKMREIEGQKPRPMNDSNGQGNGKGRRSQRRK